MRWAQGKCAFARERMRFTPLDITFKRRVAFAGWHCRREWHLSVTFASSKTPLGGGSACAYVCADRFCTRVDIKTALGAAGWLCWKMLLASVSACRFPPNRKHRGSHARFGEINLDCGSFALWGGTERHLLACDWKSGAFASRERERERAAGGGVSKPLCAQITRCLMNLPAGLPGN